MILKILVVMIAVSSLAAVVALFTKDKYTLTRDIIVHMPRQDVFDFIRLNENQKSYSRWLSFDPNTKIELKGAEDGNPGAILSFASENKKTGTGEWMTTKIVDGERIEFELRFFKPFPFTATGHFSTEALSPDHTRVTWVYNSGMNWPMNFMLLFLNMDELVGNDIQASLEMLKANLENG